MRQRRRLTPLTQAQRAGLVRPLPQPTPTPTPQPKPPETPETQPAPQPPETQQQQQPIASSTLLKVYGAHYDPRTKRLVLDVETNDQEFVSVTCWYKVYDDSGLTREKTRHGAIFWQGMVKGRTNITINNVPATYMDYGVEVRVHGSPSPTEMDYYYTKDSVVVSADSIRGLNDYYTMRADSLSKARWKYERVIPLGFGFARGGYVAVHSVSVDQNTKTVTVDIEVDGSTRRGDIASVWFGTASGMRWSTGLGRNRVTMNWSDIWNELASGGLYIYIRDIDGVIVGQIVIKPEELGITARTATELVGVDVHTHVYDYSGRTSWLTGDIAVTYCIDGRCRTGANPSFTISTGSKLKIEAPQTATVKPLAGSFEVTIPVAFDKIELTKKFEAATILVSNTNVLEHTFSGVGKASFDVTVYYRPTDVPTVNDKIGYATSTPDLKKVFCDEVRGSLFGATNAKVYSRGSYIGTFKEVCG